VPRAINMEDQNSSQNNTQSGRIAPIPSGGRCRNVIFFPGTVAIGGKQIDFR